MFFRKDDEQQERAAYQCKADSRLWSVHFKITPTSSAFPFALWTKRWSNPWGIKFQQFAARVAHSWPALCRHPFPPGLRTINLWQLFAADFSALSHLSACLAVRFLEDGSKDEVLKCRAGIQLMNVIAISCPFRWGKGNSLRVSLYTKHSPVIGLRFGGLLFSEELWKQSKCIS